MLRTLAKTTVLAAALVATVSWGLVSAPHAAAQDAEDCQDCQSQEYQAGDDGCMNGTGDQCMAGGRCGLQHGQTLNCRPQNYGQPELFYNYYIPGTCGGVPAAMYLAPQPVPPLVGHTYYTYQPFMPHELLYQHHRTYYRYYHGGRGMTRTCVKWTRPPLTGWNSSFRFAR